MTDSYHGPTHANAPHFRRGSFPDLGGAFTRVAALVRRMIGAPDYEAYARHCAEHHPGATMLSEQEFQDERQRARYSTPGNRCC